jgi:hypothetical protein
MAKLSLDWLLQLSGELDGSDSTERFRQSIVSDNLSTDDLHLLIQEALDKSGVLYGYALQDLVNALGTRLGFDVEFGPYKGKPNALNADGIWRSRTERVIVVETKTTETYQINPETLVGYMEGVAQKDKLPEEAIYGLYVIGKYGGIFEQTIRGSGYQGRIRLTTCEDLVRLAEIQRSNALSHEQVLSLMVPFESINIGALLDVIEDIIEVQRPEVEKPVEKEKPLEGEEEEPWKEKGRDYHLRKQTAEQREKLKELIDIFQETVPELGEPSWSQKYYISFSHPSIRPMWARIGDWRLSYIKLRIRTSPGAFTAEELQESLGLKVSVEEEDKRYQRVYLDIYPDSEIDTAELRGFLRKALDAYKELFGV